MPNNASMVSLPRRAGTKKPHHRGFLIHKGSHEPVILVLTDSVVSHRKLHLSMWACTLSGAFLGQAYVLAFGSVWTLADLLPQDVDNRNPCCGGTTGRPGSLGRLHHRPTQGSGPSLPTMEVRGVEPLSESCFGEALRA